MAFPPGYPNVLWTEEELFKDRAKIIPPKDVQELRQQLIDLTDAGVICEYQTIPTPPKGTKINKMVKFCMDYYWYNNRKISDLYSDQKIEQTLNRMVGNKWFSVLGMVSDLSQVPMYPGERKHPYTVCPLGFYETERMQPGYCDILATFQRLIEYIMKDMNMVDFIAFLDYIVVFGSTMEEHEARLVKTLDRLRQDGQKVSMEKSSFCYPSFGYVGHLVSEEGIAIAPEKVEVMSAWPKPKTVSELKSFLEFCGYYRHFYKDFHKLSTPLTRLLRDVTADRQKDEAELPNPPWWTRESIEGRWTKECNEAFRSLKVSVTSAPMLDRVNMAQRQAYR